MSENAELWSYPDEDSQRSTLECWLRTHNITYDKSLSTEELRQLYVDIECGKFN